MVTCDPGERRSGRTVAKTVLNRAYRHLVFGDPIHGGMEVADASNGAANGFGKLGLQRGLRVASSCRRDR